MRRAPMSTKRLRRSGEIAVPFGRNLQFEALNGMPVIVPNNGVGS